MKEQEKKPEEKPRENLDKIVQKEKLSDVEPDESVIAPESEWLRIC